MGDLTLFEERNAFAHLGVADDHARLRVRQVAGGVEGCDQCIKVVAVHFLRMPAKGLPLGRFGSFGQGGGGRAFRLLPAW